MPDQHDQAADDDHDIFYDARPPEAAPEADAPPTPGSGGSTADVFVSALLEAGPEAAEHLLKAAQELLLAAKAVVDAGERVVEQTRGTGGGEGAAREQPDAPADEPRVRRIDLA